LLERISAFLKARLDRSKSKVVYARESAMSLKKRPFLNVGPEWQYLVILITRKYVDN